MAESVRAYPYTLGSRLLNGETVPRCARDSMLSYGYDIQELAALLEAPLSDAIVNIIIKKFRI